MSEIEDSTLIFAIDNSYEKLANLIYDKMQPWLKKGYQPSGGVSTSVKGSQHFANILLVKYKSTQIGL